MRVYPILKLKNEFELTDISGEKVAVCLEQGENAYNGIIKLINPAAVFMFEKLMSGISLPVLIMECITKFGGTVEDTGASVIDFLDKLKEQSLIAAVSEEDPAAKKESMNDQ